jgi:sugar transferase (PEP-CTERM system associated)
LRVRPYWVARPKSIFLAAELTLTAATLAYAGRLAYAASVNDSIEWSLPVVVALLVCQACLYFNRLYDLVLDADWQLFVAKTLESLAAAIAVVLGLVLFYPRFSGRPSATLLALLLATFLLIALRPVARWLVKHERLVEGVLILGSGEIPRRLYEEVSRRWHGLEITGALPAGEAGGPHALDPRIDSNELRNLIRDGGISRIVLAEPDPERRAALGATLLGCKLSGVTIEDMVDFYEKLSRKIWLKGVHPEWLIHSEGFHPSKLYIRIKRVFDVFFSLLLVLAASPLLLLIAAAIKLDSEGPVLFRQERVGLDGREFVLFKFRSMRHDAEQASGPTWAHPNDARVTRLGRVLRKFRLDELPQAFNVLRGEMSFVGPRPERPYFVALLRGKIPYYDLRHYVKPGITGWAQVMYPYGACIEDAYEKLQYDFYYAKHISFGIDVMILLKTLKVVLFGKGR